MEHKKLYKSTTDCIVTGVCGGLAEYLGIPSIVIRGLMVCLGLFTMGAATIIIYVVLSAVLPNDPDPAKHAGQKQRREPESAQQIMDRAKHQQFRPMQPTQQPFWQQGESYNASKIRLPGEEKPVKTVPQQSKPADPGRIRQEKVPPKQYDSYTDCGCTDEKLGKNDAFGSSHGKNNAIYDEEQYFKEAHRRGGWS